MKTSRRIFITALLVLTLVSVMLFAGCGGDATSSTTSTPSTTSKVSTPESQAPTSSDASSSDASSSEAGSSDAGSSDAASQTPSGENLLANAIANNEELLGGDSWSAIDGKWAGPLQEVRDGAESFAQQAFVEETRADGTKGTCYRFYSEATKGYHTVGNTFGISNLLESNKSYKLTVSLKLTVPNPGERDSMDVGVTNSVDNSGPVTITAKDEWQTVTYTFKTGFVFDGAYIYVSPTGVNVGISCGELQAGFNLLVDSMVLEEI